MTSLAQCLQCCQVTSECHSEHAAHIVPHAACAGLTVGIQEAPPVCDNMPNSDTAEQSGEPVDTPVEPVWSPQYSPNRLASLIPENQPPVSNPNSHNQSGFQDQHPQGSANIGGQQEAAVPHASSSDNWGLPTGHAEHYLQHAHSSGRSASQQQQAVGPMPSGMLNFVAPWHPPLPSSGPEHGSHAVAMQHSGVLPGHAAAYAGSALPAAAQGLQGYQQQTQPPSGQRPAIHGLPVAAGLPGHEAPLGSANAPGSFQSELQPNASVYKRDGYSPLAQYDAHDNRPEGPIGSQPDAYHGQSQQSSGAVYDPYITEAFHGSPKHSNGMQHVGSLQQLMSPRADSMHKKHQPGLDSQAGVAPIGYDQQVHQQSMRGLHQQHPTHFPAARHSQHKTNQALHDHMGPIKAEHGVSAPSFGHHGGIKPEGHTHGQGPAFDMSASQMPSGAQLSTILSPELSAALAAGVLGPSIAPSGQRPMADAQHQVGYQQRPQRSEHAPPHAAVAALPPELSAALASGQLILHLGADSASQPRHEAAFHSHPTQSQSLAQQRNEDPELHRRHHAHPQYSQVPAAPTHHSVQADTARQGLSQLAMHRPNLQDRAAVSHSGLPSELYASHQRSSHPLEPPANSRPEPQLVDMPGHHQPQFDVSQPAYPSQQQAQHHAQLSQGDAPYMHGQQMHSQEQAWLHGSQQRPYDPHMRGSDLTHHPQMQPAHLQHVSDDVSMPHAEFGRHEHSQQMMQQPDPRPMAWADDRPVADAEYRPSRYMAGLPEGT